MGRPGSFCSAGAVEAEDKLDLRERSYCRTTFKPIGRGPGGSENTNPLPSCALAGAKRADAKAIAQTEDLSTRFANIDVAYLLNDKSRRALSLLLTNALV